MPPRGYKYPPGSGPKKKRGPKPFPGTRRNRCNLRVPPPQPIVRPKSSYSRKHKTDVLLYLIHHRISDVREFRPDDHYVPTRRREGLAHLSAAEERDRRLCWENGAAVSRAPTYRDAERYWKIPLSTINAWWKNRGKYLPTHELERVKDYNPLRGYSIEELPEISLTPNNPRLPEKPKRARAQGTSQEPVKSVDSSSNDTGAPKSADERNEPDKDLDAQNADGTTGANGSDADESADANDNSADKPQADTTKRSAGDATDVNTSADEDAQLAVDEQLSANVAALQESSEEDIEDSAEVHAAIFDEAN